MFFKCWREDFGFYWGRRGQRPTLAPFSAPNGRVTLKFLKIFFQNLEFCIYVCVCVHVPTRVPNPCPFCCSNRRVTLKFLKTFFQNIELYICVCVFKNLIWPPEMTFERKTNKYWLIELVSLKNTKEIYPS